MRNPEIVGSSYYHVYNRGVDKRQIFQSERDYERFLESMYLFNDRKYTHQRGDADIKASLLSCHEVLALEREPLVKVLSYELSPNHFHLFMKQNMPGGMAKFFQKLASGYTRYFNLTNGRTGRLFESSYKAQPTDFEEHKYHIPRYIHLNALDGTDLAWRDGKITDWERASAILDAYPWSSHHVYAGKEQVLPIVDEDEIRALFPEPELYWAYLKEWAGRHTIPVFLGE